MPVAMPTCRSPRPSAARGPIRILSGLCLAVGLLLPTGPAWGEEPDAVARALRGLAHPLATHREAAEREIARAGAVGRAACRRLWSSAQSEQRLAGWRIATSQPAWIEQAACLRGLDDPDLRVAVQAARALLARVRHAPTVRPLLPRAGAKPGSTRALVVVLAEALDAAEEDRIPGFALAMGEGVLPALQAIASSHQFHRRVRGLAATLMARVDGPEASRRLVALSGSPVVESRSEILSALLEVTLTPPQRQVVYANLHAEVTETWDWGAPRPLWRRFFEPRGRRWSERARRRALIYRHPPVEQVDDLKRYYETRFNRRWMRPYEVLDLVRGCDAIGQLDAAMVRLVVGRGFTRFQHRRWRGREEELGNVLAFLWGKPALREPLRASLVELLEDRYQEIVVPSPPVAPGGGVPPDPERTPDPTPTPPRIWETDLPRSVEAWARFIVGCPKPRLAQMATELIVGDGETPLWSARHLGARLFAQIDPPPVDLVRALLVDGDAWMRREAQRWIARLPEDEREAATRAALADDADAVFLGAAGLVDPSASPAHLRRLLRLAVEGRRSERGRAFQLLERARKSVVPSSDRAEEAKPVADGPLDVRLRAAARLRGVLGLRPAGAPDQGLPRGRPR